MNYYPHHIGDFNNATRHLTRIERSIYRDLIELYYDTECPLTRDFKVLCRRIIANTEQESTAVQQVLNEFFTETEQGWYHERCEREISKYHGQVSAKSAAGKASAAKRAQKLSKSTSNSSTAVQQPFNECSTNQEPITNNQEPYKENIYTKENESEDQNTVIQLRRKTDWEKSEQDEGNQKVESKKSKRVKKQAPLTEFPDQFEVTEDMLEFATNLGLSYEAIKKASSHFKDHHISKGSKFKDWKAAWRTWMRNSVEFQARGAR